MDASVRFGLISYSNSLEQIGPIGKTVSDVVMLMNAIAGTDETIRQQEQQLLREFLILYLSIEYQNTACTKATENIRVGLVKELVEGADPDVSKCIYSAVDLFSRSDCKCEDTSMKSIEYALASYYTIAMAEASSNLARYDNIRYGFDFKP